MEKEKARGKAKARASRDVLDGQRITSLRFLLKLGSKHLRNSRKRLNATIAEKKDIGQAMQHAERRNAWPESQSMKL